MIDYFLEKCGCIGNSSSLSVNLQIESLEIEEVIPPENIRISINIKFNLNCTTFLPGDSLYLLKKPEKMEEKLKNEDLDPQLMLFFP